MSNKEAAAENGIFPVAVVQLGVIIIVSLIILALANMSLINDAVIYVITVGGNFWPTACVAIVAGTYPIARAIIDGPLTLLQTSIPAVILMAFTRGLWILEPWFSGTALQGCTVGVLLFMCLISVALIVTALDLNS